MEAKELVSKMTNEEKALLLSGKDFWNLVGFSKYGLESIMVTDGPHGLRKQITDADNLGINNSEPATCFVPACLSACSFDPDLLNKMGIAMADEAINQNVSVILGPGINHKRSPLCGRNFEYFSEDPILTGKLAAGLIKGIESKGIGTSLKHFAANSQEKARLISDSIIDERALREIYLRGFEIAVKEGHPSTIMPAYNKINGVYACENKWLLDLARKSWGFDGIYISDWGAVSDPIKSYLAGLDIEMPGSFHDTYKLVLEALNSNKITVEELDEIAIRIVDFILKHQEKKVNTFDEKKNLEIAKEVALESIVLLKNDDDILPLDKNKKIALIGNFAKNPRYQGAGSSKINPRFLSNIYDALKEKNIDFKYEDGYLKEELNANLDEINKACKIAKDSDVVIICAGLPDSYESEGFDRTKLEMPDSHNKLIEEVAKVNPNVIVVLSCGSPVSMPWNNDVKGILLNYLSGSMGAIATVELLFGDSNPCGKLSETFPLRLEDTPCFNYFAKDRFKVLYKESIFTGYRYYDTFNIPVLFPFGYGLSYTKFKYSDLNIVDKKVTFKLKNIGKYFGKEIVELYIKNNATKILKPLKELKDFKKIALSPGEEKEVSFELTDEHFKYFNTAINDWYIATGEYEILIASSINKINLSGTINISSKDLDEKNYPKAYLRLDNIHHISDENFKELIEKNIIYTRKIRPYTIDSPIGDLKESIIGRMLVRMMLKKMDSTIKNNEDIESMLDQTLYDMPLRSIGMGGVGITREKLDGIVYLLNGKFLKALRNLK